MSATSDGAAVARFGRDDPASREAGHLGDEIEVPVVMKHHRVMFESGGGDQEIGDRPAVLSPPGQLVLDRERTRCHRLGQVKPRKAQEVLTTCVIRPGEALCRRFPKPLTALPRWPQRVGGGT